MNKMTICMAFLAISLTGTLLFIGLRIKEYNKDFVAKENEIKEAAMIFASQRDLDIKNFGSYEVSTEELIQTELIESMIVKDDECKGHVTIKRTNKTYEYTPYIKCKNYETRY